MKLLRLAAAVTVGSLTATLAGCATTAPAPAPSVTFIATPPVIYDITSGGMGDETWGITGPDGTTQKLARSSTTPVQLAGPDGSASLAWASPGLWNFTFTKDVSICTAVVTIPPNQGGGTWTVMTDVAVHVVTVQTSVDGKVADSPFNLSLTC